MGYFVKKNIIFILLLLYTSSIVAINKIPPTPRPNGPIPPGLPVDGGITILLFAGAIYGAYKLRKK
jgi:hypothetical protein